MLNYHIWIFIANLILYVVNESKWSNKTYYSNQKHTYKQNTSEKGIEEKKKKNKLGNKWKLQQLNLKL